MRTFVHGDDFVTCWGRDECRWFREALEGRFDIKTKVVGRGSGEEREERILNRIIRATAEGWELEADQRHADIIIKQLNLVNANGVKTPSEDEKKWEEEENL